MSFANRAYKAILKQYKKEGKELKLNPERCNTGLYKKLDEEYAQLDGNITFWSDNPLAKRTVPEIIAALEEYYRITGDSITGLEVAEPVVEYQNDFVLRESLPPFLRDDAGNFQFQERKKESEKPLEKPHDKVIDELEKALKDYYENKGNTVCDFLVKKIDESKLKPSEIYTPVYMTRQNYAKITTNKTKHPKFEACIQFAFGLKLNLEDTTELLRLAGNAFSDALYHQIVKFFIENKQYNMYELNKCLDKFGFDPIGCSK